jgi:hypothetical protein
VCWLRAGEVAQRQTVALGPPLLQLVLQHMKELGIAVQPPAAAGAAEGQAAGEAPGAEEAGQDKAEQREPRAAAQQQAAAAQQQAAAPQLQQLQQGDAAGKKQKKHKALASGDDLAGDFEGLPLLPQPPAGKKAKQREEAAAAKAAELAASVFGQADSGDEQPSGGKKRTNKKGHKVVAF